MYAIKLDNNVKRYKSMITVIPSNHEIHNKYNAQVGI